jgi:hypothetical protein
MLRKHRTKTDSFSSFDYICIPIMENQLSREGGLDSHYGEPIIKRVRAGFPLTDFTQPHVCAYPTPGPRYLRPYVIGFFCVQ